MWSQHIKCWPTLNSGKLIIFFRSVIYFILENISVIDESYYTIYDSEMKQS